jgi:hypothetical protein
MPPEAFGSLCNSGDHITPQGGRVSWERHWPGSYGGYREGGENARQTRSVSVLGAFGKATTEVTSHTLLMYTGRTEQGRRSYRESGIQPDRGKKDQGRIISPLNQSPHLSSASSIPPSPGWTTPSNPRSSPPTLPPTVPLVPAGP